MFRFFRRLRGRLLSENKYAKYFLYAMGEIVLIVIGILIALQVNNYNQKRILNSEEKSLIMALQIEFMNNLSELDALIEVNSGNIESAREMAQLIDPNGITLDEKEVAVLWNETFEGKLIISPVLV